MENSSSAPSPGTGESGNHEEPSASQVGDKLPKVFPAGALHTIDTFIKQVSDSQDGNPGTGDSPHFNTRKRSSLKASIESRITKLPPSKLSAVSKKQ